MSNMVFHTILDAAALGEEAAACYDLPVPVSCWLFNSGVNEIYMLQAGGAGARAAGSDGSADLTVKRYVLRVARVRRLGGCNPEAYQGELALLEFLHDGGLPVSRPVRRRDGGLVGELRTSEGRRLWAVFEYVEGRPPAEMDSPDGRALAEQAGRLLGKVHTLADGFQMPASRLELDVQFLIDEPLERLRRFPGLPAQDLEIIEAAAQPLREWVARQPRRAGTYGLVHGDYWWSNLHLTPQGLALIDFDFCGFGWRAYDLAALLVTAKILRYPLDADAFLAGYQAVRPLEAAELEAIPYWEKVRLVWVFGLWTTFENLRGTRWFFEFFTPALKGFLDLVSKD